MISLSVKSNVLLITLLLRELSSSLLAPVDLREAHASALLFPFLGPLVGLSTSVALHWRCTHYRAPTLI